MKRISTDSFFTPSLNGQPFQSISSFPKSSIWLDPLMRDYFEKATISFNAGRKYSIEDRTSKLVALTMLILLSPLMICIALGIKILMPGKVFYKQIRVGKDGKLFEILKFRSMIEDAEVTTGHTLSWEGDPRVTRFGSFLRKSHFDELPQLINIIRGDMYFIGPRPERPEFTSIYENTIMGYMDRHRVKPGITGLAQLACRYDATADQKLRFDLMYIARRDSATLKVLIGWHTIKKMILMKSDVHLTC